jgi:hypothetical protein
MPDDSVYEIEGVIHIHSNYSDGSKSIEEIAKIGEIAGLDFLMFSDHMTLKPLRDGLERFHNKIAVIIGYEIEDSKNQNHFLAFGLDKELSPELSAREYVAAVKAAGGLGVIAHPDEVRNAIPQYPSYPWTDWETEEFDGIEIWNHMSAWMELLRRRNMLKLIFTPRRGLIGPTSRVLKKWDELSARRPVAGIGSADVHAHAYRKGPIRLIIFPYKVQLRAIRTHLLLSSPLSDDIPSAKIQILNAIRNCRAFVSNFRWGDARGFRFFARDSKKSYQMGETIPFSSDLKMILKAPTEAQIKIIKDGQLYNSYFRNSLEIPIDTPGLYRVELYKDNRGWIYSNHLRVHLKG